jgi:hypothetical protein
MMLSVINEHIFDMLLDKKISYGFFLGVSLTTLISLARSNLSIHQRINQVDFFACIISQVRSNLSQQQKQISMITWVNIS